MNQERFYYADEQNQPVGPFALTDLKKMLDAKVLDPGTQLCAEGGSEWKPLESLLPASAPLPPTSAPPPKTKDDQSHTAMTKVNAGAAGAASIIFPSLTILMTIGIAANPVIYAMWRSLGIGFILFALPFAIGLFGPINSFKLLRAAGRTGRKPKAVVFAWIGIVLFVLSLVLLLFVGLALDAEMVRRTGS